MKDLPSKMINLLQASVEERRQFLDSFDTLMTDCDGTVWDMSGPLKGTDDAVTALLELGKKIVYVTNNGTRGEEAYNQTFKRCNINATFKDVIHPGIAAVEYLRLNKFEGAIYLIGSTVLRNYLTTAGFEVIDEPTWDPIDESTSALWKYVSNPVPVAAVFMDYDFNMTNKQLVRAQLMLDDPNCKLLVGVTDMTLPMGNIIGPGYFVKILEQYAHQPAIVVGKPGAALRDVIFAKYDIDQPKRVLFVGDAFEQDIGFGKFCGFQTMAVTETGVLTEKTLRDHPDENDLPNYYLPRFADLAQIISGLI